MALRRPLRPMFALVLAALPRSWDADGTLRLRRALKCLLRSFALRCVRVEPASSSPVNAAPELPEIRAGSPDRRETPVGRRPWPARPGLRQRTLFPPPN